MIQLDENVQSLLPCGACGMGFASGVVRVAEAREDVGFVVAVAEIPMYLERVLVAGDSLSILAKLVMGITETVQYG